MLGFFSNTWIICIFVCSWTNPFNPPTRGGSGRVQIFFGSLISDSGWVGSLSDQPFVGQAESSQVAHFNSYMCNIPPRYYWFI